LFAFGIPLRNLIQQKYVPRILTISHYKKAGMDPLPGSLAPPAIRPLIAGPTIAVLYNDCSECGLDGPESLAETSLDIDLLFVMAKDTEIGVIRQFGRHRAISVPETVLDELNVTFQPRAYTYDADGKLIRVQRSYLPVKPLKEYLRSQ
jgi:hypothetical protein